jgi:hypothetical protein
VFGAPRNHSLRACSQLLVRAVQIQEVWSLELREKWRTELFSGWATTAV